MELTPQQVTDVILQKPYRITAGILEQRNRLQKFRDRKMAVRNVGMKTRNYGSKKTVKHTYSDHPIANYFLTIRRPFINPYFESATLKFPHKRSLKNALDELRYIGYTNDQLCGITTTLKLFFVYREQVGQSVTVWLNPNKENRQYVDTSDAFAGRGYFYGDAGQKLTEYKNGGILPINGAKEFNTASPCPKILERFETELNDFLVEAIPSYNTNMLKPKRNKTRRLKKLSNAT